MADPLRGEIWLADLSAGRGHEQVGQRPVLIVSDDAFNCGPAGLIMVAPLTSKIQKSRTIPAHIPITPPEGGLKTPSVILCDQLRTISKDRVGPNRWGAVTAQTLADVETVLVICWRCEQRFQYVALPSGGFRMKRNSRSQRHRLGWILLIVFLATLKPNALHAQPPQPFVGEVIIVSTNPDDGCIQR